MFISRFSAVFCALAICLLFVQGVLCSEKYPRFSEIDINGRSRTVSTREFINANKDFVTAFKAKKKVFYEKWDFVSSDLIVIMRFDGKGKLSAVSREGGSLDSVSGGQAIKELLEGDLPLLAPGAIETIMDYRFFDKDRINASAEPSNGKTQYYTGIGMSAWGGGAVIAGILCYTGVLFEEIVYDTVESYYGQWDIRKSREASETGKTIGALCFIGAALVEFIGLPMMIAGSEKKDAYEKWKREKKVSLRGEIGRERVGLVLQMEIKK